MNTKQTEDLIQEVTEHLLSPDGVAQINKLLGKPVTKKAVRSIEAKESPRTVECSGTILSRSAKKGKPERIQVLVQFVGGVKVTPPQTKFFERKNAECPWADRDGNVFMTPGQIKEAEAREWALAQAAMTPEERERDREARVAKAREQLMRVAGGK